MSRFCVNCGTELPDEAGFCPKCGTKIEVPCCPACGKEVDYESDFCIYCGQPLKESKNEETTGPVRTGPESESESACSPPGGQAAKEPATVDPDDGVMSEAGPQEFSWSYKAALGRIETTVNTVTVRIVEGIIHIFETQSSALSKKEPHQLPEKEIPLSGIESVRVCSHWSILFGLPLLLCVPLLLYGWLASRIDWITAVLCLALVAVVAFRYSFQIHHHRLIIIGHDKNKVVLRGKDRVVLQQVEEAIVNRTGLMPSAQEKKGPALKIIGIILALLVLIFAVICGVEEIYLRRRFPNQIMLNPDVIAYAQTEINYHLAPENYDITVEITGGNLEKRTSLPKYENDVFTYLFVDYVYDITVSDGNESVSGTVTVDASFEVDPFGRKPNDILFNTFVYSDNLIDFATKLNLTPTIPEGDKNASYSTPYDNIEVDSDGTYMGEWNDLVSERCFMVIETLNDSSYAIQINWSSNASEESQWNMTAEYDAQTNMLEYTDCAKIDRVYADDGTIKETTVYSDGTGRFYFRDSYLHWLDDIEQIGTNCLFTNESEYLSGSEYPPMDNNDAFNFSSITGSWQEEVGENYLFIGYSDELRQDARAYFTMAQGFEVVLSSLDKDSAEGVALDYSGNIAYQVGIYGYKYWLEVTLQDADTDETQYLKYYPADMENCPYYNPYYLDLY